MPRKIYKYDKTTGTMVEISKCDGQLSRRASTWPRLSDTLGCNPDHIQREQEYLAKHGVYTEYTDDGRAILRDQKHANEHMAVFDYVDPDACYMQRTPTRFTSDEWKRVSRR